MIRIENLEYSYPNANQKTIKGISFSIAEGEIYGFLGPSGSGKTTTQNLLFKLLPGYNGTIWINHKNLQEWDRSIYENIGVSFELPNHYSKLTAKENLQFFSTFYKNKFKNIPDLLAMVGLTDDADKRVSDFSKGMKMRLNFIRALIHNPEILFLDEPTAGLDPINANVIKDIIKNLRQEGKTIFLTTHNMFDADQLCDRIALIHDGTIVAEDTPASLKLMHGEKKLVVVDKDTKESTQFMLDGLGRNTAFLEWIRDRNVESIHSQEATLEEVFIKLTGKYLV